MAPIIEQYIKWTSDYDAERVRVFNNFPCLQRLPKHYIKGLETITLSPDIRRNPGSSKIEDDKTVTLKHYEKDIHWVQMLPKADIHVHLGPAIPIHILYDLSMLTLVRTTDESSHDKINTVHNIVNVLTIIISRAIESLNKSSHQEDS